MKRIRESKMVTPSSASILKDVDMALKLLEIFYCANGATVEGVADRNGHRHKLVSEGESVSWGGARTKGKVCECKLTKNMFLHSDMLKLYLKKKHNITDFFLDTTVFFDYKLVLRDNKVKR